MQVPTPAFWICRAAVRELDRQAIAKFGIPGIVLMENAGRGAAELLMSLNPDRLPVTILCGPGNNGGDGFVVARHVDNAGYPLSLWLFATFDDGKPLLTSDCEVNYTVLVRDGHAINTVDIGAGQCDGVASLRDDLAQGDGWIVDALFGTGLNRELTAPFDDLIAAINSSGQRVLALDIPSGLDCDTGKPLGPTVKATHTASFVAWKIGFLELEAKNWIGEVHIVGIGAPKRLVEGLRQS